MQRPRLQLESRRDFVRLLLVGLLGAIGVFITRARTRAAGEKLSSQQSAYQDSPKGIQMCATCTLFEAPHSCKVVDGEVSPNGWRKAYAMAD